MDEKQNTMIKEKLYNETVEILQKAYFNETLEHANCCACAVGNIIQYRTGRKFIQGPFGLIWDGNYSHWHNHIYRDDFGDDYDVSEGTCQVESTGYTVAELILIENSFEESIPNDEDGFKGLMAVVDVLGDIHQVDQDKTETSKKGFVYDTQ